MKIPVCKEGYESTVKDDKEIAYYTQSALDKCSGCLDLFNSIGRSEVHDLAGHMGFNCPNKSENYSSKIMDMHSCFQTDTFTTANDYSNEICNCSISAI